MKKEKKTKTKTKGVVNVKRVDKTKFKEIPRNAHDNSRLIGTIVNDAPIVGRCPKQTLL